MFIFAVAGKEIFGDSYKKHFEKDMPRWNFNNILNSFMMVFRVLCGEWVEPMWDCLDAHGWTCVPFFICTKIVGNFVV